MRGENQKGLVAGAVLAVILALVSPATAGMTLDCKNAQGQFDPAVWWAHESNVLMTILTYANEPAPVAPVLGQGPQTQLARMARASQVQQGAHVGLHAVGGNVVVGGRNVRADVAPLNLVNAVLGVFCLEIQ